MFRTHRAPQPPAGNGIGYVAGAIVYAPDPARLANNDITNYREPMPYDWGQRYLTFWAGNQLPSAAYSTPPHAYYITVREQMDHQLTGSAFGQRLSAAGTSQLLQRMQTAWTAAAARM